MRTTSTTTGVNFSYPVRNLASQVNEYLSEEEKLAAAREKASYKFEGKPASEALSHTAIASKKPEEEKHHVKPLDFASVKASTPAKKRSFDESQKPHQLSIQSPPKRLSLDIAATSRPEDLTESLGNTPTIKKKHALAQLVERPVALKPSSPQKPQPLSEDFGEFEEFHEKQDFQQ